MSVRFGGAGDLNSNPLPASCLGQEDGECVVEECPPAGTSLWKQREMYFLKQDTGNRRFVK